MVTDNHRSFNVRRGVSVGRLKAVPQAQIYPQVTSRLYLPVVNISAAAILRS